MAPDRGSLLLASGSPRRKRLLEAACFVVEVRPPDADETWPGGSCAEGAVALAERKLAAVRGVAGLALAADTLVMVDGERLGKPEDAGAARAMLRKLSGREHEVVTGFVVARADQRRTAAVRTRVGFRTLSEAEIDSYLATGEPYDKAGGYAIQGIAGAFVDRIEGSYTNVVGLPLAEVIAAAEALS
jgi:septum formation protein